MTVRNRNVDTDAMRKVHRSLGEYIDNITKNKACLLSAIEDCRSNLGEEVVVPNVYNQLMTCFQNIDRALVEARTLRDSIWREIRQIEDIV